LPRCNGSKNLHAAAGHLAEHAPEAIACLEAARGLEHALIAALADFLTSTEERPSGSGSIRHSRIMRQFYAILEANPHDVIHVAEICGKLGVSHRTLTTCCNEALGMSASRYLKLRQLHLARRALVLGDPAATTVTQIATSHGFWELGRFAIAYRALFGERPSATLRRAPDAKSIQNLHSAPLGRSSNFTSDRYRCRPRS
jgi:AraC-like DNA-binding protein